jgi:hypothetical protein
MKTEQYALISKNGHLVNTVLWDGDKSKWMPPADTTAVKLADFDASSLTVSPTEQGENFTAEAWLESQGYGAMRLLGLLDLESQFGQQAPPKMQAVRAWINSIRAQYAETKSDWQPAPHTFESTMQEIEKWQTN